MTTALKAVEGSASRPGRFLLPGKTRYPLYRRLGGPQGQSGHVRKISPPPGFDPRTVQHVASRYTDYAIRPLMYRTSSKRVRDVLTIPFSFGVRTLAWPLNKTWEQILFNFPEQIKKRGKPKYMSASCWLLQ